MKTIYVGIESAITKFDKNKTEEIHHHISRILSIFKPPTKNPSNENHQTLQELQHIQAIIILPAAKGNATIVLNLEDYDNQIELELHEPVYVPITTDPMTYL